LEDWRTALRGCANGEKAEGGSALEAHPIFAALSDTLQQCSLPVQLLDDLLTAFIMDVTKKRYANWEELLVYCRHSANPVGQLVLRIFGIQDPEMHGLSDAICTGLQLANHWQDLSLDWARDMLYIPQDLLKEFNIQESDLTRMSDRRVITPEFHDLMKELVRRTDALLDEGAPLIEQVQGRLKIELKLTLAGGRAILELIRESGYDVFAFRPTLSRWNKLQLLAHAVF
jgi:squalene synthase HpnC